jgi:glycosyltransferase involved in cell wall biosynthesis
MHILVCHNYYRQRGGEDESFDAEVFLLRQAGHEVSMYTKHSDSVRGEGSWREARDAIWNRRAYAEVEELVRERRPDVVHCTNLFPLISPSVYDAAHRHGVPVVQSLRNYRLVCPGGYLMRNGRVCEDCLKKRVAWPGVLHACYRRSRAATAVVAGVSTIHHMRSAWTRKVNLYFTLTAFARSRFVAAGLPAERVVVKPNFLNADPGPGAGASDHVIFVGRLSYEKGIASLIEAWDRHPDLPLLRIVGDGPMADDVAAAAARNPRVEWLGHRPMLEVLDLTGDARLLIISSIWYETFGRTIMEAFAKGTPVIAANLGAMQELVADGKTGYLFEPGNAADLAARVRTALGQPARLAQMREQARAEFLAKYTAKRNLGLLLGLYAKAADTPTS